MAIEIIPDKICSHCGGNTWYIYPSGHKQCYKYIKDYIHPYSNKRYKQAKISLDRARQKQRDNLTDDYIRQYLWICIYNATGEKIIRKSITQEQIERQREALKASRKLREKVKQLKLEEALK